MKALSLKDSAEWGPAQKAALRSAVVDRQWPQHTLFKATLVADSRCQLCMDRPDGDHTDWHPVA